MRPVVVPQKRPRQLPVRLHFACAALLLLSFSCRLPAVVARRRLLDGVMVELRAWATESRDWT